MTSHEANTANTIQLSAENFEERVIRSEKPVLVDFWAGWCQPCKMIAPVLDQVAVEYDGKIHVAKLNIDDHPALAAKYDIRSIPNLLLFKGGKIARQMIGVRPSDEITRAIDETI